MKSKKQIERMTDMKKYILSWEDANGYQHDGGSYEVIEEINERAERENKIYDVLEKTGKYSRKYIGWTNGKFHAEENEPKQKEIYNTLSHLNLYQGVEYLREIGFLPIFYVSSRSDFAIDLDVAVSTDYKIKIEYHFENPNPIDFNEVAPAREVNELIGEESDNYWRVKDVSRLEYDPNNLDDIDYFYGSFIEWSDDDKPIWKYTWEQFNFDLKKQQSFSWKTANAVYRRAMQIIFNNIAGKSLQEGEEIINSLLETDVYLKKIHPYMSFKVTSYANEEFHPGIKMDVNCYVLSAGVKQYNEDYEYRNVLTFAGETRGMKEHNIVVNGKWKYDNPPFFL